MRHLNVLNGNFKNLTVIRATVLASMRRWFEENSYLEVIPPSLTGATGSCEWFPNAISVDMTDEAGNPKKVFLRQTAQLHLEPMTIAHNRVYTIGKSFRYEKQVTTRHLWEFTLVEFEGRDFKLKGLMDQLESMFKASFKAVMSKCENGYRPDLQEYISKPFSRVPYGEAIEILTSNGVEVEYGDDLSSANEQKLVNLTGGMPLFLTEYPGNPHPKQGGVIKFFSMQRNLNGVTECCDLLLPGVGETVGGAVRVGDPNVARKQFRESMMYDHIKDAGIDPDKEFDWYFDTILDDNTSSSGCGIGFERLIQFITQSQSIKDCVEFPRSPDFVMP